MRCSVLRMKNTVSTEVRIMERMMTATVISVILIRSERICVTSLCQEIEWVFSSRASKSEGCSGREK